MLKRSSSHFERDGQFRNGKQTDSTTKKCMVSESICSHIYIYRSIQTHAKSSGCKTGHPSYNHKACDVVAKQEGSVLKQEGYHEILLVHKFKNLIRWKAAIHWWWAWSLYHRTYPCPFIIIYRYAISKTHISVNNI